MICKLTPPWSKMEKIVRQMDKIGSKSIKID